MQEGGSQYAAPPQEMTPFAAAGGVNGMPATGGSEPPPVGAAAEASPVGGRQVVTMREGFHDEDTVLLVEAERGGGAGSCNRWPREETLALLRIRSEMDAVFRDATLKGPLWEGVSRKLAELGYKRSAKKCKEKFENVHKYYKRTKDGRAGRQDGKSYRFFSQLEALHSSGAAVPVPGGAAPPVIASAPIAGSTAAIGIVGSSTRLQPTPLNAIPLSVGTPAHVVPEAMAAGGGATTPGVGYPSGCISFSSNNSSSGSESEGEDTEEGEGLREDTRKRKRGGGGGWPGSRKMMAFFEGLMKQVMERQEAMQQRFLEMIEKREQDRMIREEAWRRQEMARHGREHETMAQEREVSASRDATIIAFLQKMTGQTAPAAAVAANPASSAPSHAGGGGAPPPASAPPPSYHSQPPQASPQPPAQHFTTVSARPGAASRNLQASPLELVSFSAERASAVEAAGGAGGIGVGDPASSRWPKPEVHALIKLRSGMESRYQEAGPKGPLWEEMAAEMRRLGYNRSAKRCKEKWENINKYFKKVKDGNKKRPEDAKTCPYFHQLDALYRKKVLGVGGAGGGIFSGHTTKQLDPQPAGGAATAEQPEGTVAPPSSQHVEGQVKNHGNNPDGNSAPTPTPTPNFLGGAAGGAGKEPEDLVKALRDQRLQQPAAAMEDYDKMEETDSDSMDQDDDNDDDADDEKVKMAFQIEYQQRPNAVNGAANNGAGNQSAAAAATAGSFMAMVQ